MATTVSRLVPMVLGLFVVGGCASILGIEEQTFDGGDGGGGAAAETDGTTAQEATVDSAALGDTTVPEVPEAASPEAAVDATPDDGQGDVSSPRPDASAPADAANAEAGHSGPADAGNPEASTVADAAPEAATGCNPPCTSPPNDCYSSPGHCGGTVCSYSFVPTGTSCGSGGGTCNGTGTCL